MCVLVIAWQLRDDVPLLVAANRDEAYARPASAPTLELAGESRVLLPVDRHAGGTWEGAADSGLVAVITNRPDGDFDPARRSRGLLCRDALAQADAQHVRRFLELELDRRRYNSFNLFYADRTHAYVSSWNGDLHTQPLRRGVHVLSNEHALGTLRLRELESMPSTGFAEMRTALVAILSSHDPRDRDGFRICKHGESYGTVSASLIYPAAGGELALEYAPGPPCETPFAVSRLSVRS